MKRENNLKYKIRKNLLEVFKKIRFFLNLFIITIICVVVVRMLFIASFKVPTPSMEPAIFSGDYILVNKLIPGARLFKNFKFIQTKSKPDIWRLKGWRKIKRNDILVFNFPYANGDDLKFDINSIYVKRCVALPGDSFYIERGLYRVKGNEDILGDRTQQIDLRETIRNRPDKNHFLFPFKEEYRWNLENMGPFYIPRKGDNLKLDLYNLDLYEPLIKYETGQDLFISELGIFLGDRIIENYTFNMNYYFMVGDFAIDSWDSRYWGLLPEDHIIGKAEFVWKSKSIATGKCNWNRVFIRIK